MPEHAAAGVAADDRGTAGAPSGGRG